MKKIILIVFVLFSTFAFANNNIYRTYIKTVNPKLSNTEVNLILNSVDRNSRKYNVPKELIYSIIYTESRFNIKEKSNVGAYGVMQIMEELGKNKKCNRYNISDNIRCGVEYLRDNINEFGYSNKAIAGYNMGTYGAKTKNYEDSFLTRFYVNAVLYQMNNLVNAKNGEKLVIKPYKTQYKTSPSFYSLMNKIKRNNYTFDVTRAIINNDTKKVNIMKNKDNKTNVIHKITKKPTITKQENSPKNFSTRRVTRYVIRRFTKVDSHQVKSMFDKIDYDEERKENEQR